MKKIIIVCLAVCLLLCGIAGIPEAKAEAGVRTTDLSRSELHEDVTWDLIDIVEHNAELKTLLEKAISQARELNPDPTTNPVSDLASYYAFIDRCSRAMPWEISPSGHYDSLYEQIDQGMGCLYFICDQPLEELKEYGYYHHSLVYHEPFRSWFIQFLSVSGQFLSTEESWCEEYYQNALAEPDFHLHDGTYESPENWKSFNDFFARKLSDPAVRPIASPEDDSVVIFPADSVPQGIWQIDENGRVVAATEEEQAGLAIKTGTLRDVTALLGKSQYADAFRGGTLTHTFLDINDYHRYHFPVGGTVREVLLIPQDDAPGGVITWDAKQGRYREDDSETIGWQSIETRGVVILELENGGYAAVIPVGMCQVSSVNFEETVVSGAKFRKGDPLGFFLFGGSDIIMIFSRELSFEMVTEKGVHHAMGEVYGVLHRPCSQGLPYRWQQGTDSSLRSRLAFVPDAQHGLCGDGQACAGDTTNASSCFSAAAFSTSAAVTSKPSELTRPSPKRQIIRAL